MPERVCSNLKRGTANEGVEQDFAPRSVDPRKQMTGNADVNSHETGGRAQRERPPLENRDDLHADIVPSNIHAGCDSATVHPAHTQK